MRTITKALLIIIGYISLALGILGIFLPLLPTTPFLLLAAACFLRSSDKLHRWLMTHKMLGPYIASWKKGEGIPMRAKVLSISFLWISMLASAYFLPFGYANLLFLMPAILFTWLILKQKTLSK